MFQSIFYISFKLFKFINNKYTFFLAFVLYLFDSFLVLIIPLISAKLIDALASYNDPNFHKYLYLLILVSLTRIVTNYLCSIITVKISEEFGLNLRKTIYKRILHLDFLDFEKITLGDLSSRLLNDSSKLKGFFTSYILSFTLDILFLIALAIILIKMNFLLSIILFIFIPISLYYGLIFKNQINSISKDTQEKLALLTNKVYSWLSGFFFIKAYHLNKPSFDQYEDSDNTFTRISIKQGFFHGFINSSNILMLSIPTILIFILGGKQYFEGSLTIGILFAFITYSTYFNVPLQRLINTLIIEVPKLVPILKRIEPYLDYPQNNLEVNVHLSKAISNAKLVTIKEINYSFNNKFNLKINNISLQKGQLIGLKGSNGSGKSTIAKILASIIKTPYTVHINDDTFESLFDKVFIFNQNQVLFDGTLIENVTLFEENPNRLKVNEIISFLNLLDIFKISNIDDCSFDSLNKNSFSSGQIQKIAIARLIYSEKEILILDEPETSLDAMNRGLLLEWISQQKNKFILLISHNEELLNLCNHVYELKYINSSYTNNEN